jgi:thiol-disulfide isomerase/thioredoxin
MVCPRFFPWVFFSSLALTIVFGCSARQSGDFKGLSLLPLSSNAGKVALDQCPASKCLTVYVAPWCGYCRAGTGLIIAFREYLKSRQIATRIIVGKDDAGAVREYAEEFGPDTLLDPGGLVPLAGGVPQFMVSDQSGKILRRVSGIPPVFQAPYSIQVLDQMSSMLDL